MKSVILINKSPAGERRSTLFHKRMFHHVNLANKLTQSSSTGILLVSAEIKG